MIPNHEGPDPEIPPRDIEDWYTCSVCRQADQDPPRCGTCGELVCEDCWDEHHAECNDDPVDRSNPYEPDRPEEAA